MSEPSDIERAARVCEKLAEKAGRHAESCADVDRETSEQFTEAETWLVLAAEDIRALQPDPVAEAERRLRRAWEAYERAKVEYFATDVDDDDEWENAAEAYSASVSELAAAIAAHRAAREEVSDA